MMRYEGTEELADKSTCAGVRADLKMCLLESDCCKKVNLLLCKGITLFIEYFRSRKRKHPENAYREDQPEYRANVGF